MGGGAMRTAAKAVALGGYGSPGLLSGARRKAPRPSVMAPSETDGGPSLPILYSSKKTSHSEMSPLHSAQKPSWELDDWEFVGWSPAEEENTIVAAFVAPAPRLVFGPVPTLEEAREAISITLWRMASYAGLIYFALIFLYKSILHRGEAVEHHDERCMVGEEEAIWLLRMLLPYLNVIHHEAVNYVIRIGQVWKLHLSMESCQNDVLWTLHRSKSSP